MSRSDSDERADDWFLPILEYDGASVEPLRRLCGRAEPTPARFTTLIELAETGEPHTEVASMWVLKHWLATGTAVESWVEAGPARTERLVRLLLRDQPSLAPNATLQLLQVLPHLPEPLPDPARLFAALQQLAGSEHTFIRAWAFNGLALVAHQHPAFHDEAEMWLMRAEFSESASVRVRIRKARAGKFRS